MKIAIFEPRPDLWTNPTLDCLVKALLQEGVQVDIFMPSSERYPRPELEHIRIFPFPFAPKLSTLDFRIHISNIKWIWHRQKLFSHFKKENYNLFICINSGGLVVAYPFAKRLNIPFIYASFEILFRDDLLSTAERKEKEKEIVASRSAAKILIQDKKRAELLAKENGLYRDNFIYIPVAPSGECALKKTNYAREKFNIPLEKTIVIHSGSLGDWTYADELIESCTTWPQEFVLIIHTRYKLAETNKYIQKIRLLNSSNLILSTVPLSIEEYEQLLKSVDIGLILYKKSKLNRYTQKNIMNMGLSSGKLSYYMKHGLPTIFMANQSTYKEILKSYNLGMDLSDFGEIISALYKIRENLDFYGSESQRLFREVLDFNLYWPSLRDYIFTQFS